MERQPLQSCLGKYVMTRFWFVWVLLIGLVACAPASEPTVMATTVSGTGAPVAEATSRTPTPALPTAAPTTPAPVCTPPPCTANESLVCPGDCPNGCGIVCATMTPPAAADLPSVPTDWDGLRGWLSTVYFDSGDTAVLSTLLRDAGWITGDADLVVVDFTGNGRFEWALLLYVPDTLGQEYRYPANVWVVSGGEIVYQHVENPLDLGFSLQLQLLPPVDLTGDALPELIINEESCGAHTCFTGLQVFTLSNGSPLNIVQSTDPNFPQQISVSYATISFADETGDGIHDILVNGGSVGSAGAGITRTYTEIWSWNSAAAELQLVDTVLDPTKYRNHLIYEANELYQSGDFETAQSLYEQAIQDDSLETPGFILSAEETFDAIVQFATFRLMLIDLQTAREASAADRLVALQQRYPEAPITEAAATMLFEWETADQLPALCGQITEKLETYANPTGGLENLGYANPLITAVDVCPHR